MSQKPSEIEKYELMREVYRFMIDGSKKNRDIVHYFSHKWQEDGQFSWTNETSDETKRRTIYNYIARVKETYFDFDADIEAEKGRTMARLDDLYSRMIKIKDYKGALSVIKEINEMTGGHSEKKMKVGVEDNGISIVFKRRESPPDEDRDTL